MRKLPILFIIVSIIGVSIIPAFGQEGTDDGIDRILIEISGTLTYEDVNGDGFNEVLVGGVVILPLPGFSSANYQEGQQITVRGYLDAGDTVEAISFDVDEPGAEVTPEATSEPASTNSDDADGSEDERDRDEDARDRDEDAREREDERDEDAREREDERDEDDKEGGGGRGDDREVVEISGEITEVTQNTIVVDGVTVEGGGIFQPGQMDVGQMVMVTGMYENNGRLRAITIETEGAGDDGVVEISGEITEVTQNTIVVAGVEVEGGGIFQPGQMDVGQMVKVTGVYENNGRLRAITIEEMADAGDETADAESSAGFGAAESADAAASCIRATHPVVETLSEEFDLESSAIIELYCAGNGFGDLARALLLSDETGEAPDVYLDQLNSGQEWGDITRAAGFEPGTVSPDRVLGN